MGGFKKRISELTDFLLEMKHEQLSEYDEAMVRKYIDKIKIYDDKLMVTFKAGIDIEVER